ncbi:hypothetical protein FBEOM_11267 [Fusarium beomiforme]|uniref:RanBP2-type domain-containing protein n=1 Tax=Fusarium beomiforme TaxID=44412 RepID=A0A9P5AA10_9HYPO|nr:hypothetical protein FBEOM_11267 [Fusarium beomiforme]
MVWSDGLDNSALTIRTTKRNIAHTHWKCLKCQKNRMEEDKCTKCGNPREAKFCDAFTNDNNRIRELESSVNGIETWLYNFTPGVYSPRGWPN